MARPRVSTIGKVRELLVLFTTQHPTRGLSEMAEELDWDLATTHRLANALVEIGLLGRSDDGTRYQLGAFTLELSSVYLSANPRRHELLREIDSLTEETGLTAQLGILAETSAAIVESCESDSPLRAAALLGQHLPLYATAVGKAILSQLSAEQVSALLPAELEPFTARTITSRSVLVEQLATIRATGLAWAEGELSEGLCAVAIVIAPGNYSAEPAALTCAGPPRSIIPKQWAVAESRLLALAQRFSVNHGAGSDGGER